MSAPAFNDTLVPGYVVYANGAVVSKRLGRPLRASLNRSGYQIVHLRYAGRHNWPIHQLVALAFVGPRPSPVHEVRHLDGNPANNDASNLAWGTRSENAMDRVRHGRNYRVNWHDPATRGRWCQAVREAMPTKITPSQRAELLQRRAAGETSTSLAKAFGLNAGYVRSLCGRVRRGSR